MRPAGSCINANNPNSSENRQESACKMLVDAASTISILVPEVGKRIECSGQYGTIKYIGPVETHPSVWLGIDWDDPERGKHNGSVNNVQYFTARHPTSGSFVRPERVNLGQSCIKAITSRYGTKEDEISAKINEQQLLSFQQQMKAPFLQLVGFEDVREKQSDFSNLNVVNLRMQNIRGSTTNLELRKMFPNIMELDISKNLLSDWTEVFEICSQLDKLHWLMLSENIMAMPRDVSQWRFPNMRVLTVGKAELTWDDVLKLSIVFPNLEELRVHNNKITNIDIPTESTFSTLILLDLDNNDIKNWSEINKLAKLTKLQYLLLENTGINCITLSGQSNTKTDDFPSLKKLVISYNNINNWESISELNKLQNLTELRFIKNPIMDTENFNTCIQLIVARIAKLENINGIKIQPDERKSSEYDYIKKYCLEWFNIKTTENESSFLKQHPRFLELLDKHGTPEESELRIEPKVIQGSLVEIELFYKGKVVKKKLPPTLVIQKLIMMVQRLFNLTDRPTLKYISGAQPDIEIALEDEGKELGFYSIQKGDRIIVGP